MSQLKPFLFWIVIGSILLLELAWWVLSIPDIDLVGNKADAQKLQGSLTTEYQHLKELDRRAKNSSPPGVFDAEKETDIKRLTDDYLITPAWKEVLDPHVRRYDEQLTAIKQRLVARSNHLHEPIASANDKFGWYTAYQNATEAQLKRLASAGALITTGTTTATSVAPRTSSRSNAPQGQGAPGTGTSPATTAIVTGQEPKVLDFANDTALRSIAGFFTKGADLPEAALYPQLTRQYRTMERIIDVVLQTNAANAANPLTAVSEAPKASVAAIAGVTWDPTDAVIGGDTGSYAEGWRLSIVLHGPLTALLATTAALEHPHGENVPLFVVTGGELARTAVFSPGERKDVGAETVTARIDLLVLDFTNAITGVTPRTSAATQATPGVPDGMPPGMYPPGFGAPGGPGGQMPTGPAPKPAKPGKIHATDVSADGDAP